MASILGGEFALALPIVSSMFTVKDYQHNPKEDMVEFLVAESEVRDKFPALLNRLAELGMVATVSKSRHLRWLMPTLRSARLSINDGVILTVYRVPAQKSKKQSMLRFLPAVLFLTTLSVVFVDGYLRSDSIFARMGIQDPIMLAIVYTMSLMGILGIHELGHMIAAKHYGIRISWPYFIPTIPGLGFIPPTLGAMIRMRSNMPNRNAMFDVGISGPIAGLEVAIVVSIYGASISVMIPLDEAERLLGSNELFELNPSLIMMATMQLTGTASDDYVLVMSPVMFAAWLGFLLTFLNLVPAAQLDGGHIARATLGAKHHRLLTFGGIGALFALGIPTMGALVLFLALRAPQVAPLDDVTSVSRGRKVLFIVALAIAAVCSPMPAYR